MPSIILEVHSDIQRSCAAKMLPYIYIHQWPYNLAVTIVSNSGTDQGQGRGCGASLVCDLRRIKTGRMSLMSTQMT